MLQTELTDTKLHLKRQAKQLLNTINDNSSDDDIKASCRSDYEHDKDSNNRLRIPDGDEAISNMTLSLASLMR